MDYFLRADNEQAMWSALVSANVVTEQQVKDETGTILETRYLPSEGFNIDVVGTITRPTGNLIQQTVQMDGETKVVEVPEMETLPGFHVNVRGSAAISDSYSYSYYTPTQEDLENPDFVMPQPTVEVVESPLKDYLVYPKNPIRLWF
jgi:hypothetical protein